MNWFDLGRILYEARIREAWNYGDKGERRLAQHPYPRHQADANPYSQNCAEIELAQAQAKALLKVANVQAKTTSEKLEELELKTGRKLPPFGEFPGSRPCRICGKPNDHGHFRWDDELRRNVIVEEPPE